MVCQRCKQRLPDDSEFCQYCGNQIGKVENLTKKVELKETRSVNNTVSTGVVMNDHNFKTQGIIQTPSIILDNNEYFANIFYNEFLSVYKKIQEVMKLEQVFVSRELLVFTVNYFKALIFILKDYYNIDASAIYLSFAEKVKVDLRYNLISTEFIASNYRGYASLVRKPCDWVGYTCYSYTSNQFLASCKETAQGRIALFLVECILLLKFSGRIFGLDELKSVVVIERGDVSPVSREFGTTINTLFNSQDSLKKQLDYAKGITASKKVTNSNASSVINPTQMNITCKKCGQSLPSDSDFCHMCGARVV